MPDATGNLMVNVYDGTRKPIQPTKEIILRVLDGNQKPVATTQTMASNIQVTDLPIYGNFGDKYAVWVSCPGYADAGFSPINMVAGTEQSVDVMLLPKRGSFNFREALWPSIKQSQPAVAALLAQGAADDTAAEDRYSQLLENQPKALASFWNLATAMSSINVAVGTPLDYLKGVIWDDTFARDRFFGWADPQLIQQIQQVPKLFAPEFDPGIFHGTATRSWKQTQFGEANVQLTFHEKDATQNIGGIDCVKIEPDIDYYRDLGAHFLMEVAVNSASHSLTNPKQVYVLRWIAGRRMGADFNPPYVIE